MIVNTIASVFVVLGTLAVSASANDAQVIAKHSPYAGFQDREIKSLSESDIEAIRQGRGWGLALPAELSGLPGPLHLLELRDELKLTSDQVAQIQVLYDEMRDEAITAGQIFIETERALSLAFENAELDQDQLEELVAKSAEARARVRLIHLSRHLMTPDILTPTQMQQYAVLRGYQADSCAAAPPGHSPEMWREHNGC